MGQPSGYTYGTPLGSTELNAKAYGVGGATDELTGGTFTYTPEAGTLLDAGQHTLSVTYAPSDSNYQEATKTVTINIKKATPTIKWEDPADITRRSPA